MKDNNASPDEIQPKTSAKKDKTEELRTKKIPRLVLSYTATTLIALIFNTMYNLTDALFVSWGVGDHAMGGVSVVFPFVILQGAISTAVGGGAASIVSRKLGEGKPEEAGEITLNAMFAFYITAVLTTVVGFALMNPVLRLMGITDDLYSYAKEYFIIILAGNVFSTGFSSIIRAEGKMTYGLLIWVIPITVNIVLDAVFILVLGWGVKGSALATVICQITSFSMSVVFFAKFSTQCFKGARIKWKHITEIIGIGLPSLVQMGSLSVFTILFNKALSLVSGTLGVTVFGYMSKLITYSLVPFTAITQALTPIVGYNYGAHSHDRVKQTVRFCALLSFIYAVIALIVFETIPEYLIMIFTNNTEIINVGTNGIRIISVALLFTPLPMLIGAALQAEGKKLWSLLLYASNLVFAILPIFLMGKYIGIDGIWWAYVIAGACATILALFKIIFRKNKSLI